VVAWHTLAHSSYHGPVKTIGLVSQQQPGATAHRRTRSSGEVLLQGKSHHQVSN
jgi:hypothetical protein